MNATAKISPAFEPFLSESGRGDKRDAIVLYRPRQVDTGTPRRRLRALKRRLDLVQKLATAQRPVQAKVAREYRKALGADKGEFAVSSVGANTLPIATVEVTRQTLSALAEQHDVVAVMPDQQVRLIAPKAVDYEDLAAAEAKSGLTWGLKRLGIPELWNKTKGRGVRVGVLDTGVHGDHPALAGRVSEFVVIDPLGRRITASDPFDAGRHGTHVCGTIAGGKTPGGVAIGVAPETTLCVAAILLGDATLRTVVEGISWAVETGCDILNFSLGFTYYEPLFAEVFDLLIDGYDVLPVVAIGNENHGNSSSPGNVRSAFSVGAVEKQRGSQVSVAFFSGGASLVFPQAGAEQSLVTKPDVVAPGVQVYSCIPPQRTPTGVYEYSYMDGTSMAAPHVSGVAALLMAARPEAEIADIINVLKDTARHPDGEEARPDNRWGYGLIDPVSALNAL